MSFSGLFELKTPEGLFRKLEHDLRRLEENALSTYAAFDFFVTAEHMLDWVHPDGADKRSSKGADSRKSLRQSDPLLEVCSHLANGSKHFVVRDKRHQSVDDTKQHHGEFSTEFSSEFNISRLEVHLTGAAAIKYGNVVEATSLARKVLEFWRKQLGL